ncbi:DNA replication licensing factor-like protein [Hapsidospora chrysogenum ATCC 11550]|uniref:DNA replication licensing factor-like protein n=1 Tax=Hapsidospora chrysogenum (strain ATCC 11550 / CBS 779.69 / DSM 880 / IAM 14645 / JCM 23072 / IMI 49137) TaxID=857340 RepID=A0A086T9C9_HAPC1|nr:DNA replication licensing factor-like protein [Hapsidospora chrysogenum ATCC 11550]
MLERTSPSPSPSNPKKTAALPDEMSDDEDDEETLQLKLQELQARLKLKKLQNAKAKELGSSTGSQPAVRPQSRGAKDENRGPRAGTIEVPASPVKKLRQPQEQTSPRRVQLGIDKGLKAKDVSLKRAPSLRKFKSSDGSQSDGYLRRTRAPAPTETATPSRPLSFNERLASVRTSEASNAERQKRIQESRTKSFGLGKEEMEKYRKAAVDIPVEPPKAPVFSREEVLSKDWRGSGLQRNNTAPGIRPSQKDGKSDTGDRGSGSQAEGEGAFEPYSTMHLSRRNLPHRVVARQVSGKKTMNIKDILREVKAPDFSLPDVEQDIVIFAIVAKKSEPRAHKPGTTKNGQKNEDRGKYMVLSLCDLDYEVDLFLFNSGFDRFWKLTEGTLVAILNPNIMPPPPGRQDTGKFSLVINSDEDTIIEIGISRDLGYCQSVRKDGEPCGTWVNKKRTNFCEYHTNEALKKTKASRVEINDAGFGSGPRSRGGKYGFKKDFDPKKKGPSNYDWETKTRWFATRSMSAADLIDGKDQTGEDKKERRAHLQRALAAKEKEREIMKKLGKIGDAAGREYMKVSGARTGNGLGSSTSSSKGGPSNDREAQSKATLESFNLQGKERNIHLSPIKRKRTGSSQNSSMTGKPAGLGWGSDLTDKLARMKEGEKLRKESPDALAPVRKKTRFVTEKGIREAGRESLGMELSERQVTLDDDDDDELVIVQ